MYGMEEVDVQSLIYHKILHMYLDVPQRTKLIHTSIHTYLVTFAIKLCGGPVSLMVLLGVPIMVFLGVTPSSTIHDTPKSTINGTPRSTMNGTPREYHEWYS